MAEQGQQQNDNSLGPLWIVIALVAGIALVWYFGHYYIALVLLKVRIVEAYFVSLFTSSIKPTLAVLERADPGSMAFADLQTISTEVGQYLAYPVAAILLALGVLLYFANVPLNFRRTYSMESLREAEHVNWPQIDPVVKLNLIEQDLLEGPWAMSSTPMEFAKRYQLIKVEAISESTSFKDRHRKKVTVLRDKTFSQFVVQLGPFWRGPDALPIHMRALFAVFAARANHDLAAADKLLKQISASTAEEKLNFAGTDELLYQYLESKPIKRLGEKHGYVFTVMATMLEYARVDGVCPAADFLWLKPLDRALWYLLNTIGRQTTFLEVAGPIAHWKAELEIGHRLYSPRVAAAVDGLELAIADILYEADDDEPEVVTEDEMVA